MKPTPRLITPRAAAKRLGVSYDAVHRRLRRPEVRALIREHGGGLLGAPRGRGRGRGGFRGIWRIPAVAAVLSALRPRPWKRGDKQAKPGAD
jgi:hypothetical protein